MKRYVCIHGHFYQPPRENPWLEEIELQDTAYPHHDWNERVTAECYAPNAASRILDANKRIIDIVSNYSKISFNVGPTLLLWMEKHAPEVYSAIIEADKQSQKNFSGHGSAIAQVYNHIIMPLANKRDKRTQVIWGIGDFEHRFGRRPEGMWLSETAVDIESLEMLAEQGIGFTILAQHQAKRFRKIGDEKWQDVDGAKIDPRKAYLCRLPSGKVVNIFFYDGPISHEIAFGNVLDNGEYFAKKLNGAFVEKDEPQLVHVATDGETYGHHHSFGEMALAYCLHYISTNKLADITIYGDYLEKNPPAYEVEISENTSWSCVHGIERWRDNCGCNNGQYPDQSWRSPLRNAMDWLRDSLVEIYQQQMSPLTKDPWRARDDYIRVILDRSKDNVQRFLSDHAVKDLSPEEKIKVLKLLEMQRHALLMYTSCGWFFDEISGLETIQVIEYAGRAMQLAKDVTGIDLEPAYIKILERAQSNVSELVNGAVIYDAFVKPVILDLLRVGAHYAVSSLFEDYPETMKIYCYEVERGFYDRVDMGRMKLAVGKIGVRSGIALEQGELSFAVLHLGDHNLFGGVRQYIGDDAFKTMEHEIKETFTKGDVSEVIFMMDKHFGTHSYSLWHLFKDEQRKVLNLVVEAALKEVESSFRQIYEHHYPIMQVMHEMKNPLPKALATTVEFIINTDLRKLLESEELDMVQLKKLAEFVKTWSVELDGFALGFVASRRLNRYMERFSDQSDDLSVLQSANDFLGTLKGVPLKLNLWKAQNYYFNISKRLSVEMQKRAQNGDETAILWTKDFGKLGNYLRIGNS